MTQQIRLWEVTANQTLAEISSARISREEILEDWLESDISMLDSNLLVIGRQVQTDFGGIIDLLCIDNVGDIVVIELKKGKTPREVAAQTLDYASWVKNLSSRQIMKIGDGYLSDSLNEEFRAKFNQELPETLNSSHRSLIVAESLDASTERIVHYMADLNVPINVLTVQHFKDGNGRQMLAQVYLMEPELAAEKSRTRSKRTSYKTVNELQAIAVSNGIGDLYRQIRDGVRSILSAQPYSESVAYCARLDEGGVRTVMFVGATADEATGKLRFTMHATRFNSILGISLEALKNCLPDNIQQRDLSGWVGSSEAERQNAKGFNGVFQTSQEVEKFISLLRNHVEPGES